MIQNTFMLGFEPDIYTPPSISVTGVPEARASINGV
jgi:hypothetical protein